MDPMSVCCRRAEQDRVCLHERSSQERKMQKCGGSMEGRREEWRVGRETVGRLLSS